MRKLLMVLAVLILGISADQRTVGAQTLPGGGACWACLYTWNEILQEDEASCMGTTVGAWQCYVDFVSNTCMSWGDDCASSLVASSGEMFEVVKCSDLEQLSIAWWDRSSIRTEQNEPASPLGGAFEAFDILVPSVVADGP